MALVQIDMWKRVIFPDNPSGFYTWSSVYYAESTEWPNFSQLALDCFQLEKLLTTSDVNIVHLRIKNPPGRGNVVFAQNPTVPQPGSIASEGEFSLVNVARWRLYDDFGNRSYRLNRMPLRPSDVDGENLSATGMTRQLTSRNTLIIQGWCRNSHGNLITSGEVVPRLTMWQLRHGSKRRNRDPAV